MRPFALNDLSQPAQWRRHYLPLPAQASPPDSPLGPFTDLLRTLTERYHLLGPILSVDACEDRPNVLRVTVARRNASGEHSFIVKRAPASVPWPLDPSGGTTRGQPLEPLLLAMLNRQEPPSPVPCLIWTREDTPFIAGHPGGESLWMTEYETGERFTGVGDELARAAALLGRVVADLAVVQQAHALGRPIQPLDRVALRGCWRARRLDVLGLVVGRSVPRTDDVVQEMQQALDQAMASDFVADPEIGLYPLDVHPSNVLVSPARMILCDLEDVAVCSRVEALGFAGFKLLREAVARAGEAALPALLDQWQTASAAAGIALAPADFVRGARTRVLSLLWAMLEGVVTFRSATARAVEYRKQLVSLVELDRIAELVGPW